MPSGASNCVDCGRGSQGERCWRCQRKVQYSIKVKLPCRDCARLVSVPSTKECFYERRGGPVCKECRRRISSLTMAATRAQETPQERSERGKLARASMKLTGRELVERQWSTVKSDPKLFAQARKRLKANSDRFWSEGDEETRNRVIAAFVGRGQRSKGSEALSNLLRQEGLYEGFEPEQIFHGFIPDDVNHDLRLIVEYYGDVYHCNPRRYPDPNQFVGAIQRTVGEQWARDRKRIAALTHRYGYRVVIVWESDFQRQPDIEIERIRHAIEAQKKTHKPS